MFCNKCGTKNPDTSVYCSKCGEKLNISPDAQVSEQSPKKRKTGLLIGLAAGCVAVIAVAIALVLIFTGDKTGQFEPTNSSLAAAVVSAPPSSPAPPPAMTPTDAASAPAPEITPTPTENPPATTPHATPRPTRRPTPTPTPTPVVLPPPPTLPPSPTTSFQILLPIIIIDNSDVLGDWYYVLPEELLTLKLYSDNTWTWSNSKWGTSESGTYTYNSQTLTGTFRNNETGNESGFVLSSDKQTLYWSGGATYSR